MRIIYGVSGEGSGHSSRAKEMATHLVGRGHEVHIVSYDRGYSVLHELFPATQISGLHIVSKDNKVAVMSTLLHNLRYLSAGLRSISRVRALFSDFKPDCVITDFEPVTAWIAGSRGIPLISLDNQHRMRYMHCEAPKHLRRDQRITEAIIRMMVPAPDVALATTFFQGPVKNDRTFLFPPILRWEVQSLHPTDNGYHLVYLTSGYDTLIETLRQFPDERFVVYGYNKAQVDDNLQFRAFSTMGFLKDLAAARSVIATAGFTLMSEAIYLQKPYLAFPMHGQFEQQLNGLCLEQLGYGINAAKADTRTLSTFFNRLPDFAEALQHYSAGYSNDPDAARNTAICAKLDELLADNATLLREYHSRRTTS
ncbi:MAG: glycosyltransferase family protein [Gammaproteobacteria bacterium]|nr:glycosyltransferase family protein [Gammaproteobacteria bacterium]